MSSLISLNCPVTPNEKLLFKYLKKVHLNGWYTNFGPLQSELKVRLEDKLNIDNLLLVNNGTSAIQVAAHALGVCKPISTPFSFAATSSAFRWIGQNVAYSDIDPNTYNIDPTLFSQSHSNDSDSIVATHVYGNPCEVEELEIVAKNNSQKLIFDAAHAIGINVGDKSVLSFGDASTLSFHATKVYHTVEGGAVVFRSSDVYEYAKELINFGIDNFTGNVGPLGTNAKFNEYQAAVGLSNLEIFDEVISKRTELFELYTEQLHGYVKLQSWNANASKNGSYFPIELVDNLTLCDVRKNLDLNSIQSRQYFYPSLNKVYPKISEYDCTESERIAGRVLCLPLHFYLTEKDVVRVCEVIKEAIDK